MPGYRMDTGPDPDPTGFLYVSDDQKEQDQSKPYDPEKSCWVPDPKEGFVEGEIQATKGDLITVCVGEEAKDWKKDMIELVNPPELEKCEDMSDLTVLNGPSIFHNVKSRYLNQLIYTYAGPSCVVINPCKRYPLYTNRVAKIYRGKKRGEVPPHLFGVSENAYTTMLQGRENQSLLITGESGAGKTENTKKVLAYFASVAAAEAPQVEEGEEGEEEKPVSNIADQIVQTNPIVEAFGNAKTIRNDNASRFVRFIRIHFQADGKLAGVEMEVFMLEKSRVIFQAPNDRSFNIFYQLMSEKVKEIAPMCELSDEIFDYQYVCQGKVDADTVDDGEDMKYLHAAFDVLGFSETERANIYKVTAAVMQFGEMGFKPKGTDEAEPAGAEAGRIISKLLGVEAGDLYKCFLKPKVKVGEEFVEKNMTAEQCTQWVGSAAKTIYERVFKWVVNKCNAILKTDLERANFIGVLDVPGFEIFEVNGFEQICNNFCDEKLQQFYNQQMFLLEQEEYKKEVIEWTPVDFGMDLKACIELFEKPKTGILAIMDEECIIPEATEKSFAEKLNANHLGKTPVFVKPKPPEEGQAETHFTIVHYAGSVSYNLTGWLEKNKDPLNESLVDLLKNSSNELCASIFAEQQELPQEAPPEDAEENSEEPEAKPEPKPDPKAKTKAKPKPKAAAKPAVTIKSLTSGYKNQLDRLLKTLKATRPHFIRCILPNETMTPGVIDPSLVLHQLTCTGVLEGIRMHRISFPVRVSYKDFKNRYKIFASQEIAGMTESKKASKKCLEKADLEKDLYRLGKKKVFFRSGVLDTLDNMKEERKELIISWLQAWIRGFNTRKTYKEMEEKRLALIVMQRCLRRYIRIHSWKWLGLFEAIRPMLNITKIEDELKELEAKYNKSQEELEKETTHRKQLEIENSKLQEDKYDLIVTLDATKGELSEYIEKQAKLKSQKSDLELQLQDTSDRLQKEEEARSFLTETRTKLRHEIDILKIQLEEIEIAVGKAEYAAAAKEQVILDLKEEINSQEELIKKVKKEKKHLQEINQKTGEDNQCIEDKCTHLTLLKGNLEKHLEKLEGFLEHEKKIRSEAEKQKRKSESDLRLTQQTVTDLHKGRKELEQALDRKNKEVSALVIKVEEEHQQVIRLTKQIKESEKRQAELEAESLQERQARSTAETAKVALTHEVSDLSNRLNEASAVATAQMEMNKNREAEVARLRNDLKDKSLQYENTLSQQHKKHRENMEGMVEQIDDLSRARARVENERDSLKQELEAARNTIDRIIREGADLEQTTKDIKHQLNEVQTRYDDAVRTLSDLESTKKKLTSDNKSLGRQLEEVEAQVDVLSKLKMSLESEVQDVKNACNEGRLMYTTLLEKYRNLEPEIGVLKEKLEEECDGKTNLQRLLSLASAEADKWRNKYETEGVIRAQELEAARQKLAYRLEETEVQIEQLNVKNAGLEKMKQRTAVELVQIQGQLESTRALAAAAEEREKEAEKEIDEWKTKVDAVTLELESSRKECRNYAAQNSRVSAAYKETLQQINSLQQDKDSLASENKTLMDQISNRSQTLHNIQLSFKRLQGEKEELQADLEEAEIALEQEEIKVQRAQVELNQLKQENERRLQEKDEEFDNTRKAYERSLESIRASLETEVKDKAQAVYMRKKLEADIHQLEVSLKRTKETNTDLQKAYERIQSENEDQQARLEDSERLVAQQQEQLRVLERRVGSVMAELEEAHTLLEQADRSRRSVGVKLSEADDYIRKLTSENESLLASKERLDDELQNIQADFDEMIKEAKSSEEKAKRAAMDASRLADELRSEQDNAQTQEKLRKGLEVSLRETQARMDDDSSSQKMSNSTIAKLESRIKDLEISLEEENNRHSEAQKNLRRAERRVKELTVRTEEDKKNHEGMQDLVDKLQQKIKGYKRQMEEAEEIAALNLAKYRKAQQELEEIEENTAISRKAMRMEAPQVVA